MASTSIANVSAITPWLRRPQPRPGACLRLFCFPYAGSGASIYRTWPNGLPRTVELWPVQLPGRENRLGEAPFSRLAPLVEAIAHVLLPYLDMPFAFFGHSMGALISFELARLLRRSWDISPAHLFVSGRRAPQLPDLGPATHTLAEPEFCEELRRLNGTRGEILEHEELRQLLLPLLRADFAVCQTYNYSSEPPLECPISAFGGLQDPEVSPADLRAWSVQTSAPFALRLLPGDHFFLHSAQPLLFGALTQELQQLIRESIPA